MKTFISILKVTALIGAVGGWMLGIINNDNNLVNCAINGAFSAILCLGVLFVGSFLLSVVVHYLLVFGNKLLRKKAVKSFERLSEN